MVDLNAERIAAWNAPDLVRLPVYEPGLDAVARAARGHTILVEKSTLPVRTADVIQQILGAAEAECGERSFAVLSNPEFLVEGTAIADLENPDRVPISGQDAAAIEALASVYGQWVPPERILRNNVWSSKLSKLTANAFLAQRIASINGIAAFCEATGANLREVARAIGAKFLQAGPGFGGSCFQKDILNLVYLCRHYGLEEVATYWEQVVRLNTWQQHRIAQLVVQNLFGTVTGKRIGVLGFAFKADTNDTRESPAIRICRDLLEEGAVLQIIDPKVDQRQIRRGLGQPPGEGEGSWHQVPDVEHVASGADALLLLTEWCTFARLDWPVVASLMRKPAWLFDARAKADGAAARAAGLQVWTVGEG